jgi:hypothetical protein
MPARSRRLVPRLLAALSLAALQPALALDLAAAPDPEPARRDSVVLAEATPAPWYDSGYRWKGAAPAAREPDWQGLKRDTLYFMGYQAAVIGVIYALPESISDWDNKEDADFERWRHNVSHPEWDGDVWWINYVTHPYWGAAYYIRGRERGLDRRQSFLYSAGLSTLYEYWLEPFFEPVSFDDLIITPILGSLLGEYVFAPARDRIRAKAGEPTWSDKTVLFLTDPLGVVSSWTDQVLGVESSLSVQPLGPSVRTADSGLAPAQARLVDAQRPWGVQLQMAW